MSQLDTSELEAVAAIAEVNKRGAVMLVYPGGRHIRIFPPGKLPLSLHERISRHFETIRSILLSRAAFGEVRQSQRPGM
jgi:hypothetical protein